jgi:hypothetical protein
MSSPTQSRGRPRAAAALTLSLAAPALAALALAGCGGGGTKTVTANASTATTAGGTTGTAPATTATQGAAATGATGATGAGNAPPVSNSDANLLLQRFQTAWDNDNTGNDIAGILTYDVSYRFQVPGFTRISGYGPVERHIVKVLLNSNGKGNMLTLSNVTFGQDGLGSYATGFYVSSNVKGRTGSFKIRFTPPHASPVKNDPCANLPCIQEITFIPSPA